MFHQGRHLGLEEFHIIREILHGKTDAFATFKARIESLLAVFETPPVRQVTQGQDENHHQERSEHRQSLATVRKEERDTQTNRRKDNKHDENVQERESTPLTGGFSELTSGVNGHRAHKGDWVKDGNTGNVKEQVAHGDLQGLGSFRDHGSQQSRDGSTNVGSQRQGVHLVQMNRTNSHERGQGGSDDGRGLNQDGQTATHGNRHVSIDIGGLVHDTGRQAEQHALQDIHQSQQAGKENDNGDEENNSTRDLVVLGSGIGLEEGGAGVLVAVARNETNLLALGGGGFSWLAKNGIKAITVVTRAGSLGHGSNQLAVGLDDAFSERCNELLDGSFPSFTIRRRGILDHGSRQVTKITGCNLEGEKDAHGHVVEHIVHGGTGKGAFQLIRISQLTQRHQRVCDGSTNVGSHDHVNRLTNRNGRTDERDNDGSGGRRRLQQDRRQDTHHETSDGVSFVTKQGTGGAARHDLGAGAHQFETKEEEIEEEADDEESSKRVAPFRRRAYAASLKDFTPGGIGRFFVRVEIIITKVNRSSRTILARGDGLLGFVIFVRLCCEEWGCESEERAQKISNREKKRKIVYLSRNNRFRIKEAIR